MHLEKMPPINVLETKNSVCFYPIINEAVVLKMDNDLKSLNIHTENNLAFYILGACYNDLE